MLSHKARVRFDILEAGKRLVSAVADDFEVRDVRAVDVAEDRSTRMTMLYDAGHSLDERILGPNNSRISQKFIFSGISAIRHIATPGSNVR